MANRWKVLAGQHRGLLVIMVAGVAGVVAAAVLIAAALLTSQNGSSAERSDVVDVGHIHGMAPLPTGDGLVLGAHWGVFMVDDSGRVEQLGERRSDTMALTDTDDGALLASGHPDLTTSDPINAGLLVSDDGAESWQAVALEGATDFHALDAESAQIWGIDSVTGQLMHSEGGLAWVGIGEWPLLDIAVDPSNPQQLMASTAEGGLLQIMADGASRVVTGPAGVAFLDWSEQAGLVAVTTRGVVFATDDRGKTWEKRGSVPGAPTAITVTSEAWFIATTDGLFRSSDGGDAFQALFRFAS